MLGSKINKLFNEQPIHLLYVESLTLLDNMIEEVQEHNYEARMITPEEKNSIFIVEKDKEITWSMYVDDRKSAIHITLYRENLKFFINGHISQKKFQYRYLPQVFQDLGKKMIHFHNITWSEKFKIIQQEKNKEKLRKNLLEIIEKTKELEYFLINIEIVEELVKNRIQSVIYQDFEKMVFKEIPKLISLYLNKKNQKNVIFELKKINQTLQERIKKSEKVLLL